MAVGGNTASRRQWILGGIFLVIALLTAYALTAVLATVFFALTVAYILSPPRRWIRARGVNRYVATTIVTGGAVLALVLVIAPLSYLLLLEIDTVLRFIEELPEEFTVSVFGYRFEFTFEEALVFIQSWLETTAIAISTRVPEYLLKFGVFIFVVFGVVHRERDIAENAMGVVHPAYRDVIEALHARALDTLVAIYVVQGVTAFGTILIAMPVFYLLGYQSWLTLAVLAGVLQFIPLVGPSVLVAGLVVVEALAGDFVTAALMLVLGGALIAAAPDLVLRPYLARWTTELSSMLYFVGFIGGLLSLGAIGVIVGPLVIALLLEAARLVAESFEVDVDGTKAG